MYYVFKKWPEVSKIGFIWYPQQFYEPIISRTLSNIIQNDDTWENDTNEEVLVLVLFA